MEIAIIDNILHYASIGMLVMFLLVFAVNVVTEVAKRLFPKMPTDIVVVILSVLLTVLSLIVYANTAGVALLWYYIVGAVILGIFVAYAAMFGFDKFKETLSHLKDFKKLPEDLEKRE